MYVWTTSEGPIDSSWNFHSIGGTAGQYSDSIAVLCVDCQVSNEYLNSSDRRKFGWKHTAAMTEVISITLCSIPVSNVNYCGTDNIKCD